MEAHLFSFTWLNKQKTCLSMYYLFAEGVTNNWVCFKETETHCIQFSIHKEAMKTKSNSKKPENVHKKYDANIHNDNYKEEISLKGTCWSQQVGN